MYLQACVLASWDKRCEPAIILCHGAPRSIFTPATEMSRFSEATELEAEQAGKV